MDLNGSFSFTEGQTEYLDCSFLSETISNKKLEGVVFEKVTFENVTFTACHFDASHFFYCNFHNCIFENSSFYKSELYDCQLDNCVFIKSLIAKAEFHESSIVNSIFSDCSFDWAFFNRCDLRRNKWETVSLKGTMIARSKLYGTLTGAIEISSEFPVRFEEIDLSENGEEKLLLNDNAIKEYIAELRN